MSRPEAIDAADLIGDLNGAVLTVTRPSAGYVYRGRAQAGPPPQQFQITAGVQQASGRDLLRLPEGRRSIATLVLYTTTELRTASEAPERGGATQADLVEIDGVLWEIQHVELWRDAVYFRVIVQSPA